MVTFRSYFVVFSTLVFFFMGIPFAEAAERRLTEKEVSAFLNSYQKLKPLSDKMRMQKIDQVFIAEPLFMFSANLSVFRRNVKSLKVTSPEIYGDFANIIESRSEDNGYRFKNIDDWAEVADTIMLAHLANTATMTRTQYEQLIKEMKPEMMVLFRPSSKTQVEDTVDTLLAIEKVSDNNKELAEQHKEKLKFIEQQMNGELFSRHLLKAVETRKQIEKQ